MKKNVLTILVLAAASFSSQAQGITGLVFEDVNYGGGAGRSLAMANAVLNNSAVPVGTAATVELYSAAGGYLATTTTSTAAGTVGQYTFGSPTVAAGTTYIVRVVNSTVRSTRTGAVAGLLPVQTFVVRNGSDDRNRVGGEAPEKADEPLNTTNKNLSTFVAQSQALVAVGAATVGGVDFGFNFDTIVNTNNAGQGSLRQFILNANALKGNIDLQQQGQEAQRETSLFMIPTGQARPGQAAGYLNQLTGPANSAVAVLTLAAVLPPITDATTVLDGTTQTANGGNTNTALLGTGGTVGTDLLTLDKINGPEVELALAATAGTVLTVSGDQCVLRGMAVHGGATAVSFGGQGALIEGNAIGISATSVGLPSSAPTNGAGLIIGASTGTLRNNLVGYNGQSGVNYSAGSGTAGFVISDNELVQNGQVTAGGDNITVGDNGVAGPLLIEGNLIALANSSGIQFEIGKVSNNIVRNNTLMGNGTGGTATRLEGSGIHYLARNATVNSTNNDLIIKNLITQNQSSGIVINYGQRNVRITQNSIFFNGNGTTGGFGLLSIDFTPPNGYVGGDPQYGQGDGVTANDALLDVPGTPTTAVPPYRQGNGGIDYPVITAIAKDAATGRLRVTGYVGTAPGQTQFGGATIEVYSANNADTNQDGPVVVGDGRSVAHGEAQYFVGTVTADANGNFDNLITNIARNINNGDNITSTAYLPTYGTSECGTNQVSTFTVLPVTLTRFAATASGPDIRLEWATATEKNNAYFAIERSVDGVHFAILDQIAGHGTISQPQEYSYLDRQAVSGRALYYRLRQVDTNGEAEYSPVRTVALAGKVLLAGLVPNPTAATAALQLPAGGEYLITLRDLSGRLLREQRVAGGQLYTLTLAGRPAGVYLVTLVGAGQVSTQRLVKE